jgi:outer membrane protein TolC
MKLFKNTWKKNMVSLVAVSILLFNSTIGTNYALEVKKEDDTLTLSKALELSLENNLDIKIAKAERTKSQMGRSKDIHNMRDEDDPSSGIYSVELNEEIAKVKADLSSEFTKQTYRSKELQAQLDVKKAFSKLLFSKESYEITKKTKEQSEENLKFVKKKFDLGQVANSDVLSAEAEVASKDADLVQAEISYKQDLMNLNSLIGQDLNKQWKLDRTINDKIIELPTIEELKKIMNEKSPAILGSNMNYKVSKATFELAKGFYTENVWTYRFAEQDYNIAESNHEKVILAQNKALDQVYMGVGASVQAIKMLEKSVNSVSESYRISKKRHELGMMTSHDLNKVLLTYQQMENSLINAKLNYQLAIAQLEFVSASDIKR